jgi:NAD(P)-dependent dehydrogenase (short-subunit alcohol dehydrogenase family)
MLEQNQGGRIVNVSSVAAKVGPANAMAYAAANSAVHALTRSLARELGPKGITVNAVCPGLIDTARNDEFKTTDGWDGLIRRIPLRRPSGSDELGGFIAFLCTEKAAYIHGQCINFDGGLVMEH